jgi:hypothetical protein
MTALQNPHCAPKLEALTTLRFVAAAMIVVFHTLGSLGGAGQWKQFHFAQAVSFFYILSGFILCYVYPNLEAPGAKGQGQRTKKTREFGCFSSSLGMSISSLVSLNAQVNFNM